MEKKKVAIVGVEGSGKTALMVSLGWQYRQPDGNGYYLTPDPDGGQKTLDYVCGEMGRMRNGEWPIATPRDEVRQLDWVLGRKTSVLGEISFVDFGGELYREAFDNGPAAALALKKRSFWDRITGAKAHEDTPIERLQRQVMDCGALVILVNLADIINDPQMAHPRTRQMVSIIKSMMDVMRLRPKHGGRRGGVALVFTQADMYADILQKAGSLKNAYLTYLPIIAARYPKVRLFAVSAVNKTLPSDSGFPVPAPDFGTEGFEKLVAWIAMWQRISYINWIALTVMLFIPFLNIAILAGFLVFLLPLLLRFRWRVAMSRGWRIKR